MNKRSVKIITIVFILLIVCNYIKPHKEIQHDGNEDTKSASYEITSEVFEKTDRDRELDIVIKYPKLVDLKDEKMETELNSVIKARVMSQLYEQTLGELESKLKYEMKYSIEFMSEEFLSIKFQGTAYHIGSASGTNPMYAINLNLKNGKEMTKKDMFSEKISEELDDVKIAILGVEKVEYDKSVEENIRKNLKESFEEKNCFYLTKNELVIIAYLDDYPSELG